jgi:hypothetical protein
MHPRRNDSSKAKNRSGSPTLIRALTKVAGHRRRPVAGLGPLPRADLALLQRGLLAQAAVALPPASDDRLQDQRGLGVAADRALGRQSIVTVNNFIRTNTIKSRKLNE